MKMICVSYFSEEPAHKSHSFSAAFPKIIVSPKLIVNTTNVTIN